MGGPVPCCRRNTAAAEYAWLAKREPNQAQTRRGINKFVNGWLAREQDRGAKPGSQARADSGFKTSNPFLEMLREEGAELE